MTTHHGDRRPRRTWILAVAVGVVVGLRWGGAWADARVELELVGDAHGAAMTFQEWGRALGQAGIQNVRLRSSPTPVRPGVETRGTADRPVYVVTGQVISGDELLLPSGRFRRSEVGRLAGWLDELAKLGPPEQRAARGAFGLTMADLETLLDDAAQPVGFSTEGLARDQVVSRIVRRMKLSVQIDPGVADAIGSDPVAEELLDLSCGTALACVLRPVGLCLVPRAAAGGPTYAVVRAAPNLDIWPIGWEPKKPARDCVPALYEFQNVNVQGVAVSAVLDAIAKQLSLPILLDHNAMARHGIDPAKAPATHPQSRTTYSVALRRILFPAGLKFEIRVDEADTPFLWISTVKPM